jgi:hypothetical protein
MPARPPLTRRSGGGAVGPGEVRHHPRSPHLGVGLPPFSQKDSVGSRTLHQTGFTAPHPAAGQAEGAPSAGYGAIGTVARRVVMCARDDINGRCNGAGTGVVVGLPRV